MAIEWQIYLKYKSARRNKNSGFSKTHILQIINTKQAGSDKIEETNPADQVTMATDTLASSKWLLNI